MHGIIDLELTNACPADCGMCPRDLLPKLGVMKAAVFERILEDLAASPGLRYVSLCGVGEPLLHPQLAAWARRLVALPSRPAIGLVTAGERLTPEVYAELQDVGLFQVEMSVQAVERELYQRLMPGLSFDMVMANLEHIAAHPSPRMRFAISYTEHRGNREHTAELMAYAGDRRLTVSKTMIHSRAGNLARTDLLLRPPAVASARGCRIFEKIAFIAWDGRVHYCCHDVERAFVVGDLAVDSLGEVAARKAELVRAHGGPPGRICASCDDPLRETL